VDRSPGQTTTWPPPTEKEHLTSVDITSSNTTIENKLITSPTNNCVTIATGLSNIVLRNDIIENCADDGIHYHRPGNTGSGNYTHEGLIENVTIRNVGTGNTASNDLTIYANSTTLSHDDFGGTSPNDVVDGWGDHLTFTHDKLHDVSNIYGNHDDALQSWDGFGGSNGDGAQGNPLTNLTFTYNRVENITGPSAHGITVEGPGYSNMVIEHNTFKNIGSIGIIGGVWEDEPEIAPSVVEGLTVKNNAFCTAGPVNGPQFSASKGYGSLIENWLIKSGVTINEGMTVVHERNDLYESNLELDRKGVYKEELGPGDNHNAVTCAEAEAKAGM
jgi:hypothetical protein